MAQKLPFLKVSGTKIVDRSGKAVHLRGVALGGWLMMEGYMMGGRNIAEKVFKTQFENALGRQALDEFTRAFRQTFIREDDIATIKGWGANCIRIPFNYRLIEHEDKPFSLNDEGLEFLDNAVKWCEKHSIYCILDMHAAPGAQNHDWHSDCAGKPELFANEFNRDRYLKLWYFLAGRYKDVSAVAGYDVLNEPVVPLQDEWMVKELYEKVTKEIRSVDTNHIIFLEGNNWAQRLDFLGKPHDKNTVYSIHTYPPLDFTFNYEPGLRYPGSVQGIPWSRTTMDLLAKPYMFFTKLVNVPLYVGEFGVNARDGFYGENDWVSDLAGVFEDNGVHWTYWTYKTVANSVYPDGVYRYTKNPSWVGRQGPLMGLEALIPAWQAQKAKIIDSWKTDNFRVNEKLLKVLKGYF